MAHLTSMSIDLAALYDGVQSPELGGTAAFIGTVRNHHAGRPVERLEYSAYAPMAEAECARIVAEAEEKWPARVVLAHRIGKLALGEIAVAIAAAAAHRDEAFAACRYVIEEVKHRVPIWKKEFYTDGTVAWVDPTAAAGALPARDGLSRVGS